MQIILSNHFSSNVRRILKYCLGAEFAGYFCFNLRNQYSIISFRTGISKKRTSSETSTYHPLCYECPNGASDDHSIPIFFWLLRRIYEWKEMQKKKVEYDTELLLQVNTVDILSGGIAVLNCQSIKLLSCRSGGMVNRVTWDPHLAPGSKLGDHWESCIVKYEQW